MNTCGDINYGVSPETGQGFVDKAFTLERVRVVTAALETLGLVMYCFSLTYCISLRITPARKWHIWCADANRTLIDLPIVLVLVLVLSRTRFFLFYPSLLFLP